MYSVVDANALRNDLKIFLFHFVDYGIGGGGGEGVMTVVYITQVKLST